MSVRPRVYTINPHRAFADALAAGLIARYGKGEMGLAQGVLLVPSNRAVRAITDAFVRRSGSGLLLPRLIPVGDPELDERIGGALDPIGIGKDDHIPPAIEPVERLFLLARLVQEQGGDMDAAEALRLAQDLARTLDQLLVEEVDPLRLRNFAAELPDLSLHWQKSLERLTVILDRWPGILRKRGAIDLADRRNRLLASVAQAWRTKHPPGFVAAAGITAAAPAVARLLRTVSRLPDGMVVLPALDLDMPEDEWERLGPHERDPETGRRERSIETHPQFNLKLLLDRMGVSRKEVESWRWGGGRDAPAVRSRAIANAMKAAADTAKWAVLPPAERRLTGVRAMELADPAEEAQTIAIALREALEEEGRTAALVTPDRGLARRVSAHLRRWGIEADDSAGRPLSQTPPGTLLLALASAGAEQFAPISLLAVLKHPLVRKGDNRLQWLEGARMLDLALRGPRPPAGLAGITEHLADRSGRDRDLRERAASWWREVVPLLRPFEETFRSDRADPATLLAALREAVSRLTGEEAWGGQAGREAARLFADMEAAARHGPDRLARASLAPMLDQLMANVAIRPPYGQHPRLFIWGLLEARLQHADLMILAGLNEGTWPQLPTPDPWLAPRIRHELGLPSLERRIGLSAHDFATGLGGRQVIVTRARRDARAPAIASRFWLRLEAMTGGLTRSLYHRKWAMALDRPTCHHPAKRPEPSPPKALRPGTISVTDVDRLKADPYAFYARQMLRLSALEAIDADPSPAWRGTAVHAILESWMKEDDCDPARLRPRAEALLARTAAHPLLRALWQPRLLEAIEWIASEVERNAQDGRRPLKAEVKGAIDVAGIRLHGRADRIDRRVDGGLVILDYKTGTPPGPKAIAEGYSMQLGLLGLIAERGGFEGVDGSPVGFEYWSLAKKAGRLGHVASPTGKNGLDAADFTSLAARNFIAAANRWLTGNEPFTAKLHPEYAPYGEHDQLMRLDEWYGRDG
ncbi:double-strand break repair protein AddB [Sphingosinicella rhizophila]|uniref:Double-strand break repair protein AddB n=1 Tax=Sphingosinicella rhizophila TaxID=3050082 RepID=A0ABU3Q2H3_9SPHN|nr:double-strand break repair protein AddB [Sphingosinicella sp. GR2756]MDT9597593.1 double-strand break repair protein AddB [Sphingosinicella sp. GR2756]